MRPNAIRLLMLNAGATALVTVAAAGAAEAGSRHIHRHHVRQNHDFSNSWAAQEIRPVAPAWNAGGDVCPGNARSFDCKIWPPPFDQDPDRRISGSDGGM
jgi:hypothetical protein